MNHEHQNTLNMQTYNGKTLEEIEANLHPDMPQIHRDLYLNNCKEVINNEAAGVNLDYCQTLRNSNFLLTNFYLTGKHK
jgi:hypothetical protein